MRQDAVQGCWMGTHREVVGHVGDEPGLYPIVGFISHCVQQFTAQGVDHDILHVRVRQLPLLALVFREFQHLIDDGRDEVHIIGDALPHVGFLLFAQFDVWLA